MKRKAVTSNERQIAKALGIQPCHVHANELLDLADAKDRDGYRAALQAIEAKHGRDYRSMVGALVERQLHMQSRYHTHNPWRTVWKEQSRVGVVHERREEATGATSKG